MTLYELPLDTVAIIKDINCADNIRRRLLDLGLVSRHKS